MKFGFLFGAGAEIGYGLPSGGQFALDIFRYDTTRSKEKFKVMRDKVDKSYPYAANWLPDNFDTKNISSFGKSVFQNIIKDTVEHNRRKIVENLNAFDEVAKVQVAKMRKMGVDIDNIFQKVIGRSVDNVNMSSNVKFIDEFKQGNGLFGNSYFSALLLAYKKKTVFNGEQRNELGKIILSIIQLQVGALSEELTRKINDSLFSRKDDEIDIFDDIGEIIQLNYSASGLSGMEYLLEQRKADIKTDENCILRFAQLIIEDIYGAVMDYKSLIDANWHYLYSPHSDWAKFCKISIFLLTVQEYITEQAKKIDIKSKTDGYYHVLKNAVDNNEYEISAVATTNYNKFIAEILKCNIAYLNGSTETWYDPYLNRLGEHSELETEENHILVPLMFTQSGTKPMTSINMSICYVETYNEWKASDAIVVVGFGFGTDDEHINGILRTLIDIEDKKMIVVTLGSGENEDHMVKMIAGKLKVSKNSNIKILQVDKNGKVCGKGISWSEAIKKL